MNFLRTKLILLVALTLLIVLALQGIAKSSFHLGFYSWWDGGLVQV